MSVNQRWTNSTSFFFAFSRTFVRTSGSLVALSRRSTSTT